MVNANKIEKIRSNIQTSTLLSDHEKADWLNLLELMNDKQLGELEEILAAEVKKPTIQQPAATATVPSKTAPAQNSVNPVIPALKHIANMPASVQTQPQATPVVTAPQSAPQSAPQPTTQLSAPQPKPQPAPKFNPLPRAVPSPTIFKKLEPAPQPQPVTPVAQPASAPQPAASQSSTPTQPQPEQPLAKIAYQITDPNELQQLTLQSLRKYTQESIMAVVKTCMAEFGYFGILQIIEASQLYASYVAYGQKRLNGEQTQAEGMQIAFTQEEFEFMTDLMRKMRFNQL